MPQKILTTLLLLLTPIFCSATVPIDSLFLTMPLGMDGRFSTAERLNLLHTYSEMDSPADVDDGAGDARILYRNDSLLVMQVSEAAAVQLCVAPNGDIAIIKTTLKPAAYSRIKVYDDNWQVKRDVTPEFQLPDFLKPVSEDSLSAERQTELCKMMNPLFVKADFAKDGTGDVLFSVSAAQLVKGDAALAQRLMLKSRRLTWADLVARYK